MGNISGLKGNLLNVLDGEGQKIKNINDVIEEMKEMTVKEALEKVATHRTFLQENTDQHLVVTTIDHAKSQEFDTVFLIGADRLFESKRWYVSVTRARERFFALIDEHYDKNHRVLDSIYHSSTTITCYWHKDRGGFYERELQEDLHNQSDRLDDMEKPE
jgi:superfamily I DNA/RNA helicase